MKIAVLSLYFVFIFQVFTPNPAYAWGSRGHGIIGANATLWLEKRRMNSSDHLTADYARVLSSRSEVFRKASTIPDEVWKSPHFFWDTPLGNPTHFLNAEFETGLISDVNDFANAVRNLPANYLDLKAKVSARSPLTEQAFNLFSSGTSPWRTQQFFDLGVEAFKCASTKQLEKNLNADTPVRLLIIPPSLTQEQNLANESALGNVQQYKCDTKENVASDISTAFAFIGAGAHFLEDATQPLHNSADHDGWVTGNGGIHAYFETDVLKAEDTRLDDDVLAQALDAEFEAKVWSALHSSPSNFSDLANAPDGIAQLGLNVAADALTHKKSITDIDDASAIDGARSQILKITDNSTHPAHPLKKAQRLPADNQKVLEAFRPVFVERLGTGVIVLSAFFETAWKKGGSPEVTNLQLVEPGQMPFIYPDYDLDQIKADLAKRK